MGELIGSNEEEGGKGRVCIRRNRDGVVGGEMELEGDFSSLVGVK